MRKALTFIAVITLLWGISSLFINSKSSPEKKSAKSLSQTLIEGKWVNRADGYKTTYDSKDYTKRNKTINFKKNDVFIMDSAKQSYIGTWKLQGDTICMAFKAKTVSHLLKKAGTTGYVTVQEEIQLKPRKGLVVDDVLQLSDKFTYTHRSDGVTGLMNFWDFSSFPNATWRHLVMILVAFVFLFLAIKFDYEPLLLIPIGMGILIGNIPMFQVLDFNLGLGIYEPGSVMNIFYSGVVSGWFPPLIFLGIGAMTDFSTLISSPRLMLLGAAAQLGIFVTFLGAIYLGFEPQEAGAIGIIGGADGPTAIFTASKLANGINILANGNTVKNLIGPIAIAAYSYMALVPVIQPPIMRLLTTKKERLIRMRPPRTVAKTEKILFPIVGLLMTALISPSSLPLLGMLFFGNLLKESGVTKRLADTAKSSLIDIVTMLLGITVGASTQADVFLTKDSVLIFGLGAASFMVATAGGVLFAKLMNVFSSKDNPVNPLIGAAGVSAVPDSARVAQMEGLKADPTNHLLMHAMAPNVAGVIGSAIAAGILLSFLM